MGPATLCREKPDLALAADDNGALPLDVLFKVLLHLPVDVLCRLRLVCRSWRSLTSDPMFARAHVSRHPLLVGVHIGALPGHYEVRVVDLSGNVVKRVPLARPIIYALNMQLDMVCISTGTFSRSPNYVLDLATGEVIAVFDAPLLRDERDAEELISPFLLGHVPSTGKVKVFHMDTRAMQVCSITTLGNDDGNGERWRVTPDPPVRIAWGSRDRVVIGGVAYFLLSMQHAENDVEPDAIAVFDLATEEWRPTTLRGPLSSRLTGDDEELVSQRSRYDIHLAAVDGCLVTLHRNRCQGSPSMDLWFLVDMDVDKGLWTKRYSIPSASYRYVFSSYPLRLLDNGKIMIWDEETHVLRVYDPRPNRWVDLATLRNYFSMNMYQGNLLYPGLLR